jgi:SAM-dependent methyltransferase
MDTNGYLHFRKDLKKPIERRVQGFHDLRLDGIGDLIHRARGATVFDIGCNRGLVGFEFGANGATRVMGCDVDEPCIWVCRELFADLRHVPHRFEVVDLTGGVEAMRTAFGKDAELKHDIVLMLATYHKLKRIIPSRELSEMVTWFGTKTTRYFGWRGYEEEIPILDKDLGRAGLTRIHTSLISDIQPAAIWARR